MRRLDDTGGLNVNDIPYGDKSFRPGTPSGERLGLNPSDCEFDSRSGHCDGSVWQLADHSRLEREMLWVRVPPEPLRNRSRPRGAARSARRPVKAEITGSNPVGDA